MTKTQTQRQIVTIDATDKVLGRLATQIAMQLMGKTTAAFEKHIDLGAKVIVTNVDKIKVTGKKMEQKMYHHHTGHPGGLRTKSMQVMWDKDPAEVLRMAVSRMLPKNKQRTPRMLRLIIS